ncbi:MAG: sodium-translocating pyrophosphatase [Candidatus Omnitrophica bacterium CG11_big_fil_rev_8_21_14_0_20_42_13]|uniref:Putative K(+)-stimulated pyrophosphate-energized sodium pump n=1 Tax=Candidatus Ghiorseimicrobium undicola TaxID=1974746 RepID=A0A2H0LY92_9BACT|nr:MAG: sodium-translocating pyrophosphatase [Candidatus Omnitrophica bacterium CG11_big_fil_rev_8_21_14_0_20_42_13]
MSDFNLLYLVPLGSILALAFAAFLAFRILRLDEGTDKMKEIALAVKVGARAYLRRQYFGVSIFFAVVFFILLGLSFKNYLPIFVPFAFLTGGFFSGLAGYIGMIVATNSSARTANEARKSLNSGLKVAFSSGAVMGMVVVGLGLLDLSIWYFLLDWYYTNHSLPAGMDKIGAITSTMLCFGMGASSQALFARVGGGIFTKAADVGADLVGKVEVGIPEDDPRNPAVIADNVGDNVGDVAGMGADLYESYVGSIVATMALAVAAGLGISGITIPLVMAAVGVVASIIGTFFVRSGEKAEQGTLLWALRRGVFSSALIIAVCSYFVIRFTLGLEHIGVYWSILSGLITGILIGLSTEFFTSDRYRPTRSICFSSQTGPATVIISGLGIGMLSTAVPVVVVVAAILISFYVSGGASNFNMGLYGVGISAVGMLSTLGITLATDAYGPVADNAGGNAEMSGLGPEIRKRTDALDSLGNTTAATGKGFAIGSAALTALALIAAYKDQIDILGKEMDLSLMNPRIICGLFMGGMLPFLFSALTMGAVGRAASKVVVEVRRQFREIKGLMEGKSKPDYATCVKIVTAAAQKEMILPALVAICAPLIVGIFIGIEAGVGLLVGSLVSGFVLAVMMANSGGAWDNAKKYIEGGEYGGKGSLPHKAAVVGDTVGDPFKDTAGPSLNILIKLMSMVSIVFASFVVANTFFK